MKNFRKVLALILVVATLFSFVAMASAKSASEYTDYDEVKYVEAVDVLTALGIINGYDGAYHPADSIDRDEMAKMIAVLRNAGDFDADLFVTANKFADVKGQWAEGYVAYCNQLGIIDGYNATTFAPDAAVKVVEVAKMLLCTLGFDAQKQGYVGANWAVAVLRDATKYGLIPADVNPYEAATRDEAAQMFLNALRAPMVAGYVSENIVKVTNSLYVGIPEVDGDPQQGEGYHFTDISLKEAEKLGWEFAYGNAVVSNKPLYTIYEGVLELSKTVQYDCFGRPGHEWYLVAANGKKTTIGFYTDTPVWTTDAPTTANVAAALTGAINGYTVNTTGFTSWRNGTQDYVAYGNGIETELYAMGNGVLRLVQIDTFVGKVGTVNSYRGTFTIVDNGGNVDYTFAIGDYKLEAGDIVLYQLCKGTTPHAAANTSNGKNLHNVTVVEPVLAAVSDGDIYCENYRTENAELRMLNCFTAEGKTYYYSENYAKSLEVGNWPFIDADDIVAADGHKWNIYVDQNGYVVYAKADVFVPTYEYAYLVEKTATKTNYVETVGVGAWDYSADLVKYAVDGKLTATEDVAISAALYNKATAEYDNVTVGGKQGNYGTLIKYHMDEDGKFVFDTEAKVAKAGTKVSNTEYVLGTAPSGDTIVATSKTVFMVRTLTADGYVYNQYTGYAALPGEYTAEEITSLYGNTGRTNIQYFYNNTAVQGDATGYRFATYVFIDAKYQASADHFFTLGTLDYKRFETALIETGLFTDNYFVYDGFVNGERAVIASDEMLEKGEFYNATATYLFDVTIGGKQYPLYAKTGKVGYPNAAINFNYIVAEDEVYVGLTMGGKDILPTLAKDAKIFILGGEANAAGKVVLTVKAALGEYADYVAEGEKAGYVILNAAGTQVTELYIIDNTFYGVEIWN